MDERVEEVGTEARREQREREVQGAHGAPSSRSSRRMSPWVSPYNAASSTRQMASKTCALPIGNGPQARDRDVKMLCKKERPDDGANGRGVRGGGRPLGVVPAEGIEPPTF